MNREDFNMLNSDLVYFDNGATTLKPKILATAISDYYNNYSANASRGDYQIALKVDQEIAKTREKVREFINAKDSNEIVFTTNTTDSMNKIIYGYFKYNLKENDEVLITKSEHASNVLPWFELADEMNIKVNYIPLNDKLSLDLESVKKCISSNTKVISLAYVTNVVGDIRPIKEIVKYAHQHNILVVVDGAQAVAHMKVDVQELDIDFLAFSAHKMCGPTGVGILYGKEQLLNKTYPTSFGGGMNATFTFDRNRSYKDIPNKFEAGTINIAGIIGFGKIIDYLNSIGMDKINVYENELRKYAIEKLKTVKDIVIYNEESNSAIITFNIKDIFSQDLAIYLDKYNICVRAGNHCAKMLKDELKIKNTCRVSLYFYNTKEEIDKLVQALNNPFIKSEII